MDDFEIISADGKPIKIIMEGPIFSQEESINKFIEIFLEFPKIGIYSNLGEVLSSEKTF